MWIGQVTLVHLLSHISVSKIKYLFSLHVLTGCISKGLMKADITLVKEIQSVSEKFLSFRNLITRMISNFSSMCKNNSKVYVYCLNAFSILVISISLPEKKEKIKHSISTHAIKYEIISELVKITK